MELIKKNPTLVEFSSLGKISEKFPLKKILFSTIMNNLPTLKVLRYLSGVSDKMTVQIVEKHPDLEELDLSNNPLTKASVPHLMKLKKLKSLTLIDTQLTLEDILDLTAELPELKFLTIKLKKSKFRIEQDHRKIMDIMALREIEVRAIDPKR